MQRKALLVVTGLALAVTACSRAGAGEATTTTTETTVVTTTTAPTTTTTSTSTTTTTQPPPVSPLNGLPAQDQALLDRGVLAVKIDNHWNARPQSGLPQADAVYELLVEAGLTRFIALFHDNDSEYLGPMRSGRPTDPTLLLPLGATFAISGAQDWVVGRIVGAGVRIVGEVRPATFRISARSAPHNLYVDTSRLREYAEKRGYPNAPPPDLFAWGESLTGDGSAELITLSWSPQTTVRWQWDGERYMRSINGRASEWRSRDGETGPVTADTLVVLFAPRYTAYPPSGTSGTPVPAMDTVGSGRALVFSQGLVAEGEWWRDGIADVFTLTTPEGEPLAVPPGVPWISVFPDSRSVTW